MKDYLEYVGLLEDLFGKAGKIGAPRAGEKCAVRAGRGGESFKLPPLRSDCEKKALVIAPHPDDESIGAALPLRLAKECGFSVVDVAVTLGSNKGRRKERRAELEAACGYLGWGLRVCANGEGFDNVNPRSRGEFPDKSWNMKAEELAAIIDAENPAAVFTPHSGDWNKTHVGVSLLTGDAFGILEKSSKEYKGIVVEAEYWGAMGHPNLLAEVPREILAAQIAAVSLHKGEVERCPYHLRLPAFYMDNVRRGGEIVGGQGGKSPSFAFGAVYNVSFRRFGEYVESFLSLVLDADKNAGEIFKMENPRAEYYGE